jgi:hypothetical protein
MTPFERYLYDNGLFDDVIRPEIVPEDVILEPTDLCIGFGCGECIGYWKKDGLSPTASMNATLTTS